MQRDRFRLVVESAPNAIVVIDERGTIVAGQLRRPRLLFGYTREGARRAGPVEVLVPERFRARSPGVPAELLSRHREARPDGRPARDPLRAAARNGSEFPVEIGLNPIATDEGTMVLSAVVDITRAQAPRGPPPREPRRRPWTTLQPPTLEQFAYVRLARPPGAAAHDLELPRAPRGAKVPGPSRRQRGPLHRVTRWTGRRAHAMR